MKSIFEYFKFKILYFVDCVKFTVIKQVIMDIDDRHQMFLTMEQIEGLAEDYLALENPRPDPEDFVFSRYFKM